MVPHPLGTRLPSSSGLLCNADRVGMYELRTADASYTALPLMLALRCGSILYGTTAVQYRLSAVWALSAAVRPAFAVLIYAPKLGYPRPRLKTFSRFVYTHVLKLCYTTIMREEALPCLLYTSDAADEGGLV